MRYSTICILACVLLSVCLSTFAAKKNDKISYQRLLNDEAIESDFEEGLRWQDTRFTDSRVQITVYNGYVLLYGEVPSQDLVDKAQEHAQKLKHVRRVFNQIEVGEIHNPATLDDLLLSARIKGYLWSSANTDASKIRYQVDRNIVYMMGLVTVDEARRSVSIVQKIDSVDKVITVFEYVQ